jgi:hypothetical protein
LRFISDSRLDVEFETGASEEDDIDDDDDARSVLLVLAFILVSMDEGSCLT